MGFTNAKAILATSILGVLGAACGSTHAAPCPNIVVDNQPAIFHLSCGPTNLTSVALSGPCSGEDASPSNYLFGAVGMSVAVHSPSSGNCHVVLTFATGFAYSADVTFRSQTDTQPGCATNSYTAPNPQTFTVDNPSDTCVDAGP